MEIRSNADVGDGGDAMYCPECGVEIRSYVIPAQDILDRHLETDCLFAAPRGSDSLLDAARRRLSV